MADNTNATDACFDARGRSVVSWIPQGSDTPRYINPDPANKRVMLEVCLDRTACLFRLRVPVRLKSLDNAYLYFHIPPDHISSLEWTIDFDAPGLVRQQLNGSITRLHFRLRTPGQLIVPAQEALQPKKPATARAIEALSSLAVVDALSVHVEHTVLSKQRLELLDAAIKSGSSSPPARLLDLRSLYNGKGGKYLALPVDENAISTASEDVASIGAVDSPPLYDEVGTGPPIPPILSENTGKRRRRSTNNSSSVDSPARPHKRATHDGNVEDASPGVSASGPAEKSDSSATPGLLARLEALVKMQQETIQKLSDTVDGLESSMAEMQERLDKAEDKVDALDVNVCELGETVDELQDQIPDVDDKMEDIIHKKISDEVYEQMEEKMLDVFARIRNAFFE
jgi:uncharacterized coiled-coil protein SlyX